MESQNFNINGIARESIDFFLGIAKMVVLGLKNYWKYVFVIFVVLGVLFYFKYRKTETYYVSKASLTYNFVHKKVYGDLFYYLQQLASENKTDKLADVLELSPEITKEIKTLEAKNIVNSPLHQDFTFERIPFYLYLTTTTDQHIPQIQESMVNYITNNKDNNRVAGKEIEDYKATLKFVNKDIKRLDSIIATSDSLSESILQVFHLLKERQKEQVVLTNRLSDLKTIAVLSSFQPNPISKAFQNKSRAKKFLIFGVLVSLLLVTFMQWYLNPKNED